MSEKLIVLRGTMHAHTDVVTAISTPIDNSDMILTSSRDKSIIIWDLTKEDETYGVPRESLIGHSHFVQDVALSSDRLFAVSCSRDRELRLWDLNTRTSLHRFVGHTKDVLSVALSKDNCHIVSGSRDGAIRLWNTLGECEYTIEDAHADWISCVGISPRALRPIIVSSSWDKTVKVWRLSDGKLICTLSGHSRYVNSVAVSPDCCLLASGGKDGVIIVWDIESKGKRLFSFETGSTIHALCFCPNRYWVCAATESSIMIWDLESETVVDDLKINDLKPEAESTTTAGTDKVIHCTCLNWSADGTTLFSGYTDGVVRVWGFNTY
ncbi:unnamed protein product [Lathyrus sativus]|nr:unnamed protein product [Lathyrus sativus]